MDTNLPFAILTADLGYGDAGKGSLIDFLARSYPVHTVVRYNGGAQAAHNVVTPDGRVHTFSQFGSAAFLPGVHTHLSRFMLTHPLNLLAEERDLQKLGISDAFSRLSLEREALVISPFQQAANRLLEMARGENRHGSCGLGIGETMSDWLAHGENVLFAGDLADRFRSARKLRFLRDLKWDQLELALQGMQLPDTAAVRQELRIFNDPQLIDATADIYQYFASQVKLVGRDYLGKRIQTGGVTLFEGAQGILLDEWYGFFPYNTWSTLTFQNAQTLLDENEFSGEICKLGLIRAYATRHGAGPFVSEDAELTAALPDAQNINNPWQRNFRVGYLDLVALRYALAVAGRVDGLVVSHLDRLAEISTWKLCEEYRLSSNHSEAHKFFELTDNRVSAIYVPADPTDLDAMRSRTELLNNAAPVYTVPTHRLPDYLDYISSSLNLPIAVTSYGPTALDKVITAGDANPLVRSGFSCMSSV